MKQVIIEAIIVIKILINNRNNHNSKNSTGKV